MTVAGEKNRSIQSQLNSPERSAYSAFLYSVATVGCALLAVDLYNLFAHGVSYHWVILTTLAVFAGTVTVKIPGTDSKASISETVIFLSIILCGTPAGAVTAAVDGIMGSLRAKTASRKFEYGLFNTATMVLSAGLAGEVFFRLIGRGPLIAGPAERPGHLLVPLLSMALVYYLANSGFVAAILALDLRSSIWQIWRRNLMWASLLYLSGACVAGFIALNNPFASTWVAYLLPFLLVTYFAYRTYHEKALEDIHVQEINQLHLSTIGALAMAIDAKDHVTHGHADRVMIYARGLARAVGVKDESIMKGIEAAALLHDIGNLAVPEFILNKPGKLTPSEFEKVKAHPIVGANILGTIKFPYPVAEYVRHHHEHWDGSGYPDGLRGEEIPLGSRILAVVDGYEALTCERTYQQVRSRDDALQVIQSLSGKRYDPRLVSKFEECLDSLIAEAGGPETHEQESQKPLDAAVGPAPVDPQSRPQTRDFRPFQAISSSQKEVSALYELARTLGTTLNLQETLTIVSGKISKIIPFTTCVIYVCSQDRTSLRAEFVSGENQDAFRGYSMPLGECLSGWVAAQKEPAINADPEADLHSIRHKLTVPLEHSLIYPLVVDDLSFGAISLYASRGKEFRYGHFHVMEIVAQQAARAVYNALTFEGTREDALTDALTSLPNLRFLHLYLDKELNKMKRYGTPFCLLVMDLDGFKAINDTYGHQTGDRVLTEVSLILKSEMRGSDVIVRYGGDEFVAVLPGATSDEAAVLIERIRAAMREFRFVLGPGEVLPVGISIGWASCPGDGNDSESLLKTADEAMYKDQASHRLVPVTVHSDTSAE